MVSAESATGIRMDMFEREWDEILPHVEDDLRMELRFEHVNEGCQCQGKTCSKCKQHKCVLAFSFLSGKYKHTLRAECRRCLADRGKAIYKKNAESRVSYAKQYYHAHKQQYSDRMKAYRLRNRDHLLQQDKARHARHAERERTYAKRRYYRPLSINDTATTTGRLDSRAKYQRNRESSISGGLRWRQRNAEHVKAYRKRYRQENRHKIRTFAAKRRAISRNAGGEMSASQWAALQAQYEYRCLCCGMQDVNLTIDHVVPLSKGGTNLIDNIQPLCKSCNCRKGKKIIDYRPK